MSLPLSASEFAQPWLAQFSPHDQSTAIALLDSLELVSADNFRDRLAKLIVNYTESIPGAVGLYVERELPKRALLFDEPAGSRRRAMGKGPEALSVGNPDIGSEGIIAQLVSELCRRDSSKRLLNHPGPDDIRLKRVRSLLVITDFIGSGKRGSDYIQALWRVHSVRSWRSLGLVSLGVIAYSATAVGAKRIRRHRSRPVVEIVRPCPTIATEFGIDRRREIRALCEKYDPFLKPGRNSVGYDGGGALLAFAHGLPNNAPLLLHKASTVRPWTPIFPARVTEGRRDGFKDELTSEQISRRLDGLGQYRLAVSPRLAEASSLGQRVVLVLASLTKRGLKTEETVASRTGLTIPEVRHLLIHIKANKLVDDKLFVSDAGHRELKYYKLPHLRSDAVPPATANSYYPKSLRPPRKKSS